MNNTFENEPVVYRIPSEILEQIFLDCYEDNSIVASNTDPPFNIAQTCSRWREISTCIPTLWSSFPITFSSTRSYPSLPVLQKWLYRSGACPISFSLIYYNTSQYSISKLDTVLFELLRALVEHLSRWESVYLDLSGIPHNVQFPSDRFDHVLNQIPSLPKLKNLEIRTFQTPGRRLTRHPYNDRPFIPLYFGWLSTLALLAPSLERYSRYGDGYRNNLLTIPTHKLTNLYLEGMSEVDCLQLFQSSPSLVEVHFSKISSVGRRLQGTFRAPGLRKLILEPQKTNLHFLFSNLNSPKLTHLEILADHLPDPRYRGSPIDTLHSFFQQSLCPLTTLVIRPILLTDKALENCLTVVSSTLTTFIGSGLEKVDVKRIRQTTWQPENLTYCIGDSIMERLIYSGEPDAILCPRLENVTFHRCVSASEGKLGDFIESRWRTDSQTNHVARIQKVDVELFQSDCRVDVKKLEGMFKEGLQGGLRMAPGVQTPMKEDEICKELSPKNVPVLQPPSNW
ncbi:hypothetical protein K435DRAFT_870094 [Dendrothele bispora CBS 962.96]|uniref:Uncharacterized protein n=1 Tax=Dendrothele bispora (strain CBS 962.96) TaxID=1314807 RepID=A0A4S8L869_DENBC|nr:hypothetical protein K435DRAFT_870094 [Dendrothele bispora CBS 962.96]